jgi:hypothetical protein
MKYFRSIFQEYHTTIAGFVAGMATVYAHGGFDHCNGAQFTQAATLVLLGCLATDGPKPTIPPAVAA